MFQSFWWVVYPAVDLEKSDSGPSHEGSPTVVLPHWPVTTKKDCAWWGKNTRSVREGYFDFMGDLNLMEVLLDWIGMLSTES